MSKSSIFISYSHEDEKWMDRIEKQLSVLAMQGSYEIWTDRQIGVGEDWYQEIEKALRKASVAILLVSANSLTSKFILNKEVVDMLMRRDKEGLRIIPIIVSDCAWQELKWLSAMQVRPQNGEALQAMSAAKRAKAITQIVVEVATIIAGSSNS